MENTPENTTLSASEYERQKTAQGRVEDIAYTINHSLACSAVDIFGAPISDWTEKRFNLSLRLPGHDHSHEHGLANWVIGEVVGDYAAVPVTVAFQRWMPGFMNSLRWMMEPVLGPLFRMGAHSAAKSWAARNGFAAGSSECKERERQIYEHEVRHLPQALMWTASSSALNIATQYGLEAIGGHAPQRAQLAQWLWGKAAGKLAGAGMTAGAVVAFRGVTPQTAERWDSWTSKHVFLPLTTSIGHWFGVKKEDVERAAQKQEQIEKGRWTARLDLPDPTGRSLG